MTSKTKLTELEQILLDAIKDSGGLTEKQIIDGMSECFGHHVRGSICGIDEIHLMIATLENNSYITALDSDPIIYRVSRSDGRTIEISALWLRRTGGESEVSAGVELLAEIGGQWRVVMTESLAANFSHIAESRGAANWPLSKFNEDTK